MHFAIHPHVFIASVMCSLDAVLYNVSVKAKHYFQIKKTRYFLSDFSYHLEIIICKTNVVE